MKILITHNRDLLKNFFSARAVAALKTLGEVRLNDSDEPLRGEALIADAHDCQVIISDRLAPGEAAVFERLPNLLAFLRCAVDARNVDVAAASHAGVLAVRCSAGYAEACSELALGLMIDLGRGITQAATLYHQGVSAQPMVFGRQLAGACVGIVGFGEIGKRIAALCLCAGMRVQVYDPYAEIDQPGVTQVSFAALLATSEYVVAAAYATPETSNMFDANAFGQMRRDSFFINIARGVLVDEQALYNALSQGQIQGAGLDVGRGHDEQPNPKIAALANVIATPHIAGLTPEASDYQAMECVQQVEQLLAGNIPSLALNPEHASRLRSFHHA